MNHWIIVFTGITWNEFLSTNTQMTGFQSSMKHTVSQMKADDICLCYISGIQRWVGAVKVVEQHNNSSHILDKMSLHKPQNFSSGPKEA